jgi:hypothetical protein
VAVGHVRTIERSKGSAGIQGPVRC